MGNSSGRKIHNDPFNDMIEHINEDGSVREAIGGCINGVVAGHIFKETLDHRGPGELLRLRFGGRIIEQKPGNDRMRLEHLRMMGLR